MYKEIFIYPAMVSFVFLLYHSIRRLGKKHTFNFFFLCLIFIFIREYFYQNYFHVYTFKEVSLKILNVPVPIVMGWLYTAYIALFFAENYLGFDITKIDPKNTSEIYQTRINQKIIRLISIALIIQTGICFCIETTAMTMGWWEMNTVDYEIAPLLLPFVGWAFTIFITMFLFFILSFPIFRTKKNLLLLIDSVFCLFYGNFLFINLEAIPGQFLKVVLVLVFVIANGAIYLSYWDLGLFFTVGTTFGGIFFKYFILRNIFSLNLSLYSVQIIVSIIGFCAIFLLLNYLTKSQKISYPFENIYFAGLITLIVLYFYYI